MGLFDRKTDHLHKDFSKLKTDIHSHLLPVVDDGSQSVADSLEMIRGFRELGYRNLITTPHINSDLFENTEEDLMEAYKPLQEAVQENFTDISVEFAAEYYLNIDFIEKIGKTPLLTFGKDYLLVEFSFYNPPFNVKELIFKLQSEGYNPILAHPERYLYWHNQINQFSELSERGVYLQVNMGSFAGKYNIQARKMAEKLAQQDLINFLGSDLHSPKHLPMMNEALASKHVQKLLSSNRLLNDTL